MAGLNVNITQDANYFWDLPGWTSQDLINSGESGSSTEGGEVSMTKAPTAEDKDKASSKAAETKAADNAKK